MNPFHPLQQSETHPSSHSLASPTSSKSGEEKVSSVAMPIFVATRSTSSLSPQPSLATWGSDLEEEHQLPLFDFTQFGPDIGDTLRNCGHVLTDEELSEIQEAATQVSPNQQSRAMNLSLVNLSLKRRDLQMLETGIFHISEEDKETLKKDLSACLQILETPTENMLPLFGEAIFSNSYFLNGFGITPSEWAEIQRAGQQVAVENQFSAMNLSLVYIALKKRDLTIIQSGVSHLNNREKEILKKELEEFAAAIENI